MGYPVSVNDLVDRAYATAVDKGFWDYNNVHTKNVQLAKLALITSEIGEAVEAVRTVDADNLAEELADICIRVFDLAGALGFDLEQAILDKMDKNEHRSHMHGKLA